MPPPHIVPQPTATWDPDLYGFVLFDGYSKKQPSHSKRSDSVYTEPYFLRFASHMPIALKIGVQQTRTQWAAFEQFWRVDLSWGHKWFLLPLNSAGFVESLTVHMSGWTTSPKLGHVQAFNRIEADLEALLLDPVT